MSRTIAQEHAVWRRYVGVDPPLWKQWIFRIRKWRTVMELGELVETLTDEQERRCAYGTREGDGRSCDCKYHPALVGMPGRRISSEVTGCPELRHAIRRLVLDIREEQMIGKPGIIAKAEPEPFDGIPEDPEK